MTVTIFHSPKCSTSRNALALLREREIEPTVVEYLKTGDLLVFKVETLLEVVLVPRLNITRSGDAHVTAGSVYPNGILV